VALGVTLKNYRNLVQKGNCSRKKQRADHLFHETHSWNTFSGEKTHRSCFCNHVWICLKICLKIICQNVLKTTQMLLLQSCV